MTSWEGIMLRYLYDDDADDDENLEPIASTASLNKKNYLTLLYLEELHSQWD